MKLTTKIIGDRGEALAQAELLQKGFAILDTNWRYGHDELDIVCEWKDLIVFVEVKTREFINWDDPESWISKKKQSNIIRAAQAYIELNEIDQESRFDIVAVQLSEAHSKIIHIEEAFYPLR